MGCWRSCVNATAANPLAANSAVSVRVDGDICHLDGIIDFTTAPALLNEVAGHFTKNGSVVIDFSAVSQANSAALALLLQWKDQAAEKGCTLNHQNLPESIQQLSEICQVSTFI